MDIILIDKINNIEKNQIKSKQNKTNKQKTKRLNKIY